ncbi:GIY-YIG nuclease family protein [Patescibacteria group bacterium]|nr:GIY-YIG nuclease family protein [Patescibacteria group bacterium]
MTYYVYILANRENGALYVGVTNDLHRRIQEHRESDQHCFTKKYKIDRLVHQEAYTDVRNAIAREKQLKKWNRQWKIILIEKENPTWKDLAPLL